MEFGSVLWVRVGVTVTGGNVVASDATMTRQVHRLIFILVRVNVRDKVTNGGQGKIRSRRRV
jgi:hypothetical protein